MDQYFSYGAETADSYKLSKEFKMRSIVLCSKEMEEAEFSIQEAMKEIGIEAVPGIKHGSISDFDLSKCKLNFYVLCLTCMIIFYFTIRKNAKNFKFYILTENVKYAICFKKILQSYLSLKDELYT
jgi:hypothetical protein